MSEEERKDIKAPEEAIETPKAEVSPDASKEEVKPAEEASAPAESPQEKAPEEAAAKKPEAEAKGTFHRQEKAAKEEPEMVERVVKINRVSKVVKGGKNFSFSALVVTGDAKGSVGVGLGKSNEVVESIKKGAQNAKRNFIKVKTVGDTIPHEVIGRFKASRVIMKPASPGTGVIAGGPVRAMCDAVGIKNILTKTLGSRNAVNVVKATVDGFEKLRLKRRGVDNDGT